MNILSLENVSKTLVDVPLFEGVTLGIDDGERIGFIGRNGTGKSTFLKILQGALLPDTGTVSRQRGLAISMLEQHPVFAPGATLAALGLAGAGEAAGAAGVQDSFRSYCRELGLPGPDTPAHTLSGGMLRKASLARCLSRGARLLLLDEPTNHLDLETIEWLEALLGRASFGFVLVTHDRYVLEAACSSIMEIDGRQVRKHAGSYSRYLELRAGREEARERAEERRQNVLRREFEWLRRGPRARTGKDKGRKQRIAELLDGRARQQAAMEGFSSAHRRLGKKVLELHGVTRSFDGRPVIRPFTYSFRRGERIGLLGPNGSGKTTFLRLVSGDLEPDAGTLSRGENTVFGHFTQTGTGIDRSLTVLDFVRQLAERVPQPGGGTLAAEQFLEKFLFPRGVQGIRLERLSGGEVRRLTLVRLLATAPNFLLLDEPTNDLDLDTIRLLEEYLDDFPGCILLVSHDRALLDRLTESLFLFDGKGDIRRLAGNYEDYRDLLAEEKEPGLLARPAPAPRQRTQKARLSFKEQKEYELLVAQIDGLEREQKELEHAFQAAVTDPVALARDRRRYADVAAELEAKLARWEELAERAGE